MTNTLAARWKSYLLGSALLFWLLGAGLLLLGRSDLLRTDTCARRHDLACWAHANGSAGDVVLIVLAAVLVIGTASLLSAAAGRVLALTGGEWPDHAAGRAWLARRRRAQMARRLRAVGRATAERDDPERQRFPPVAGPDDHDALAPTRIGNARAAALRRVLDAYGLDLAVCWPVLLEVLPDETYKRLAASSATVLALVQQWVLSCAAIVWLPLIWTGRLQATPRIVCTVLLVAAWVIAVRTTSGRLRSATFEYLDGVEATVTAHRRLLYTGLGLQPPADSATEPQRGAELSAYLNLEGGKPEPLTW
ncbi:hypothetical protein [Micromonospora sp. DT63]|uniref:hypothetical protein n=1 Tax=Micromonospora sp. DT63 TaxID=3393441 RepID=UPI003CEF02F2